MYNNDFLFTLLVKLVFKSNLDLPKGGLNPGVQENNLLIYHLCYTTRIIVVNKPKETKF